MTKTTRATRSRTKSKATPPKQRKFGPLDLHESGQLVHQVAENFIKEIEEHYTQKEGQRYNGPPFPRPTCPVCGTSPSNGKYELLRHVQTHLKPEDKKFHCSYEGCNYPGTVQECNLKNHVVNRHTLDPRVCNTVLRDESVEGRPIYACGWSIKDNAALTNHRQTKHGHPTLAQQRLGKPKPRRVTMETSNVVRIPSHGNGEFIWPDDVDTTVEKPELTHEVYSDDEEEEVPRPTPVPPSARRPRASARATSLRSYIPLPPRRQPPTPTPGTVIMVPYLYTPATAGHAGHLSPAVGQGQFELPPITLPNAPNGVLRPLPFSYRPAEMSHTLAVGQDQFKLPSIALPNAPNDVLRPLPFSYRPADMSHTATSSRGSSNTATSSRSLSKAATSPRGSSKAATRSSITDTRYSPYAKRVARTRSSTASSPSVCDSVVDSGASEGSLTPFTDVEDAPCPVREPSPGPSTSRKPISALTSPVSNPPVRYYPPSPPWSHLPPLAPAAWEDMDADSGDDNDVEGSDYSS